MSFAGTEQRNHNREEAMNKLGIVDKNDRKNVPLDVCTICPHGRLTNHRQILLMLIQTVLPSLFTGGVNFVIGKLNFQTCMSDTDQFFKLGECIKAS